MKNSDAFTNKYSRMMDEARQGDGLPTVSLRSPLNDLYIGTFDLLSAIPV